MLCCSQCKFRLCCVFLAGLVCFFPVALFMSLVQYLWFSWFICYCNIGLGRFFGVPKVFFMLSVAVLLSLVFIWMR